MKLQSLAFKILLIIALAFALPNLYDIVFNTRSQRVQCYYSAIKKQFFTNKSRVYFDEQNNIISQEVFNASLPFMYYHKLLINGQAPDSIEGISITADLVSNTQKIFRLTPANLFIPNIKIFPLLYQAPNEKSSSLTYFAFTDKLRVLSALNNCLDTLLTNQVSALLKEKHFQHPAKNIFGTLTKKNITNEGMFIVDANNHFYNLALKDNLPTVEIIKIPAEMQVSNMINTIFKDKSFYGIVIDQENKLYLLETGSFRFIELPIDNYDPRNDNILWVGNLLTTTVNINKKDRIEATAFNSNSGKLIRKITIERESSQQDTYDRYSNYIFPFTFSITSKKEQFIRFYADTTNYYLWLINSLISILIYLIFAISKRRFILSDLILISVSGIYGLLTYLLHPKNKA